jgi:hypothetical protein
MTVVRCVPLVLVMAVGLGERLGALELLIDTETTSDVEFEGWASRLREFIRSPRVDFAR